MSPHLLALGFTLLHFCWQAALIAGLYKTVEILLPGLKPAWRYALALAALLAMLVVAVATFIFEDIRLNQEVVISVATISEAALSAGSVAGQDISLHTLLPWLDMVWLVGVLFLTLRMAGGLWQIHSLSRAATEVPEALLQRFAEALHLRGLSKRVKVRLHPGITGPFVVGVVRAVVYLPFSAVTHLSPSQLDAVLAHELEHVRRFDYVWNLVQTLVETLFFYHPAVWWLGRVLREQRELCCDDAALAACNDPLTYATALLRLEEQRPRAIHMANGLVMALNGQGEGSGLLLRVKRMLGEVPAKASSGRYNPMVAVPLILLSLSGFVAPVAQVAASTPAVKAIAAAMPVPAVPPAAPAKPAKGVKTTQTIRIENGKVVSNVTHTVTSSETSANTKRIITVVDGRVVTDNVSQLSEAEQAQIEAHQEAAEAQREAAREAREAAEEARHDAEQARLEADQDRLAADQQRREADQQRREADRERLQAQREAERERQQAAREVQQAAREVQREAERNQQERIREQADISRQKADEARINAETQRLRAESMLKAADRMAASAQEMAAKAESMRVKAMSLIAPPAPPAPPSPPALKAPIAPQTPPSPLSPSAYVGKAPVAPVAPVAPKPLSGKLKTGTIKTMDKGREITVNLIAVPEPQPNPRPTPQPNPKPNPQPLADPHAQVNVILKWQTS